MDNIITKKCSVCGCEKSFNYYTTQKGGKFGLRAECNDCLNTKRRVKYATDPKYAEVKRKAAREWSKRNPDKKHERRNRFYHNHPEREKEYSRRKLLKNKYGLTVEEYDKMLIAQGGKCICGRNHKNRLHVDHNHKNGEIRGLLCYRCNYALGLLGDDPQNLEKLANYLRTPPGRA
jgi:hypothetical protein